MTATIKRFVSTNDGSLRGFAAKELDPTLVPMLEKSYAGIKLGPYEEPRIDEYINDALEETHLPSERQLAEALKISPSTITHWRKRKTWPSDALMFRLADMAEGDRDAALIALNIWRTEDPDAKETYRTILRLLWAVKSAAMALAIFFFASSAPARAENAGGTVHSATSVSIHYATFGIAGAVGRRGFDVAPIPPQQEL